MTYCSEARKQHNFLRIFSFVRANEMEFDATNLVLPHAGIETRQNPPQYI